MLKKNLFLRLILLYSMILGPACSFAQEKEASARQAQGDLSWDFGKISEGTVVKHDFIIKNEGDRVLNIGVVSTSCGCTRSEMEKKIIPPGEESVLSVSFDSTGYSGDVWQFVFVNSDDPKNPVIRFTLKASVVK